MVQNPNGSNNPGLKSNPPRENTVRKIAERAIKEGLREGRRYIKPKNKTSLNDDDGRPVMWRMGKGQLQDSGKPNRYEGELDNHGTVINKP